MKIVRDLGTLTFQFQNTLFPPQNENCQRSWHFDFSVSEYPLLPPLPPENENCQRSWHFDFSVSEYPPPKKLKFRQILALCDFSVSEYPSPPENLNLGRSSQWETMCGKLPHVETLSNPDNYSFPLWRQR